MLLFQRIKKEKQWNIKYRILNCFYTCCSNLRSFEWEFVTEENFVFWFGAQINSTHNFTQSGWLILFILDSFPGSRNWVSWQTRSLWLNNAIQCRRLTGGSSTAAAWTHEGTYLCVYFSQTKESQWNMN